MWWRILLNPVRWIRFRATVIKRSLPMRILWMAVSKDRRNNMAGQVSLFDLGDEGFAESKAVSIAECRGVPKGGAANL